MNPKHRIDTMKHATERDHAANLARYNGRYKYADKIVCILAILPIIFVYYRCMIKSISLIDHHNLFLIASSILLFHLYIHINIIHSNVIYKRKLIWLNAGMPVYVLFSALFTEYIIPDSFYSPLIASDVYHSHPVYFYAILSIIAVLQLSVYIVFLFYCYRRNLIR